jgi:hypothetical protein
MLVYDVINIGAHPMNRPFNAVQRRNKWFDISLASTLKNLVAFPSWYATCGIYEDAKERVLPKINHPHHTQFTFYSPTFRNFENSALLKRHCTLSFDLPKQSRENHIDTSLPNKSETFGYIKDQFDIIKRIDSFILSAKYYNFENIVSLDKTLYEEKLKGDNTLTKLDELNKAPSTEDGNSNAAPHSLTKNVLGINIAEFKSRLQKLANKIDASIVQEKSKEQNKVPDFSFIKLAAKQKNQNKIEPQHEVAQPHDTALSLNTAVGYKGQKYIVYKLLKLAPQTDYNLVSNTTDSITVAENKAKSTLGLCTKTPETLSFKYPTTLKTNIFPNPVTHTIANNINLKPALGLCTKAEGTFDVHDKMISNEDNPSKIALIAHNHRATWGYQSHDAPSPCLQNNQAKHEDDSASTATIPNQSIVLNINLTKQSLEDDGEDDKEEKNLSHRLNHNVHNNINNNNAEDSMGGISIKYKFKKDDGAGYVEYTTGGGGGGGGGDDSHGGLGGRRFPSPGNKFHNVYSHDFMLAKMLKHGSYAVYITTTKFFKKLMKNLSDNLPSKGAAYKFLSRLSVDTLCEYYYSLFESESVLSAFYNFFGYYPYPPQKENEEQSTQKNEEVSFQITLTKEELHEFGNTVYHDSAQKQDNREEASLSKVKTELEEDIKRAQDELNKLKGLKKTKELIAEQLNSLEEQKLKATENTQDVVANLERLLKKKLETKEPILSMNGDEEDIKKKLQLYNEVAEQINKRKAQEEIELKLEKLGEELEARLKNKNLLDDELEAIEQKSKEELERAQKTFNETQKMINLRLNSQYKYEGQIIDKIEKTDTNIISNKHNLEEQLYDLHTELDGYRQKIQELENPNALEAKIMKIEAEISQLNKELEDLEELHYKLNIELDKNHQKIQELENALNDNKKSLKKNLDWINAKNANKENYVKYQINLLEAKIIEIEAEISQLNKESENFVYSLEQNNNLEISRANSSSSQLSGFDDVLKYDPLYIEDGSLEERKIGIETQRDEINRKLMHHKLELLKHKDTINNLIVDGQSHNTSSNLENITKLEAEIQKLKNELGKDEYSHLESKIKEKKSQLQSLQENLEELISTISIEQIDDEDSSIDYMELGNYTDTPQKNNASLYLDINAPRKQQPNGDSNSNFSTARTDYDTYTTKRLDFEDPDNNSNFYDILGILILIINV